MKTIYILLLLVVIIITTLIIQKMNDSIEPFKADIYLVQPKTCPHKMDSYIDGKTQQSMCCDGTVKENICSGLTVCTLTPSAASNVAGCAQYLKEYNAKMQAKHCFNEMAKYYEDASQEPNISGCASQVNGDQSGPVLNARSCRIYKDAKDNTNKVDSCVNAKMKFDLQNGSFCKMVNCTAALVRFGGSPPLVSGTYGNPAGMGGGAGSPNPAPQTCYSKESVIRYFKSTYSGEQLTNILKDVNNGTAPYVCGYIPPCNKKARYVVIQGPGYVQISQIVVKDANGKNIAKDSQTWSSEPYGPQSVKSNAVDGNERTRAYPNIYHSKSNDKDSFITVELNPPVCISQIVLYGRSDCCPQQHANKIISILGENGWKSVLWKSSPTTNDLVQTFNIPVSVFA
jgi:hypothetical protein